MVYSRCLSLSSSLGLLAIGLLLSPLRRAYHILVTLAFKAKKAEAHSRSQHLASYSSVAQTVADLQRVSQAVAASGETPAGRAPNTSTSPHQDPFYVLATMLRDVLVSQRRVATWQPEKTKMFLVDKVQRCNNAAGRDANSSGLVCADMSIQRSCRLHIWLPCEYTSRRRTVWAGRVREGGRRASEGRRACRGDRTTEEDYERAECQADGRARGHAW